MGVLTPLGQAVLAKQPKARGSDINASWRRFALVACVASGGLACTSNDAPTSDDGDPGSGTASGMVGKQRFESVADARWIGAPDDPAKTRVIYVFDNTVSCSALSNAGWDQVVQDGTQAVEIKIIGTGEGTYPVSSRPATGEADVNYTLTSTSSTPSEITASAGSVTITSFVVDTSADGSFDLTVPGGSVAGTFHATYCPSGHEP
jgi:hypothetical protein